MYWKLFEALYEAHSKRKAAERCASVKDAIVAGIWGNSNYDPQKEGQEGARKQILETIEDQYRNAIRQIYTGEKAASEEIDWDDPFFAASKAPRMTQPPATTTGDRSGEESAAARKMLEDVDQT